MNRSHDTRLLENLVKCEREYCSSLSTLLSLSHSSVAALSAYGAALSSTTSRAVLSVSLALNDADSSFQVYASSIDDWREKLSTIKKLDAEIDTAVRDREILYVTDDPRTCRLVADTERIASLGLSRYQSSNPRAVLPPVPSWQLPHRNYKLVKLILRKSNTR